MIGKSLQSLIIGSILLLGLGCASGPKIQRAAVTQDKTVAIIGFSGLIQLGQDNNGSIAGRGERGARHRGRGERDHRAEAVGGGAENLRRHDAAADQGGGMDHRSSRAAGHAS